MVNFESLYLPLFLHEKHSSQPFLIAQHALTYSLTLPTRKMTSIRYARMRVAMSLVVYCVICGDNVEKIIFNLLRTL